MLTKSYIQKTLKSLDSKYNKSTSPTNNLYFSKLAMLELCGWLEESIDTIIADFAKKNIKKNSDLDFINNEIKRNYGFAYERNFKGLLIKLVGIITFNEIEKTINEETLILFTSTLKTLKTLRDSAAHTHIKGITRNIDSPSKSIVYFNNLYNGLHEFEDALKNLKA